MLSYCKKYYSFEGLLIHQGRMKCGRTPNQHDRTASAGQMEETQRQVTNHRAAGPNNAERVTSVDAGEEMDAHAVPSRVPCPLESRKQRAYQGRGGEGSSGD